MFIVGREAAAVVFVAVEFSDPPEGARPTICVTSSVAVDVVAVVLDRLVEVLCIDTPGRRLRPVASASVLNIATLLGRRATRLEEGDCEWANCIRSAKGKRNTRRTMRKIRIKAHCQ